MALAQTSIQDAPRRDRSGTPTHSIHRGQPLTSSQPQTDRGAPQYIPTTTRLEGANRNHTGVAQTPIRPDSSRVYWDEQPDRPIWIRGGDYKASFGPDGFQFIPFLGSKAPQNYPVAMDLERVQSGEVDWEIREQAIVRRDGDRITLDHGSVQVLYAVEAQSVEQFFYLGEVSQPGAITLQLDLTTELPPSPREGGWQFANDLGGVRYSQAIVFDEAGQRETLSTSVEGSQLRITVPASFVAAAQGAITVDPVVNTFTVDDLSTRDFDRADIAYAFTNDVYLYVYEEYFSTADTDIYSVHVDGLSSAVSNGSYINIDETIWSDPAVAYQLNDDTFMVVAGVAEAATPTETEIRARMRDSAGTTLSAEIVIDGPSSAFNSHSPDIGGDTFGGTASYFCIVWERDFSTDSDVWMAMYDGTGVEQQAPSVIQVDLDYDLIKPHVSKSTGGLWGTDNFNVAWIANALNPGDESYIYAQQFSWNGTPRAGFFQVNGILGLDYLDVDVSECVAETHPTTGERLYIVTYDDTSLTIDLGITLCAGTQVLDTQSLWNLNHTEESGDRDDPVIATTSDSWIVAYADLVTTNLWDIHCSVFQPVSGRLGVVEPDFLVKQVFQFGLQYEGIAMASTVSGGAPQGWTDANVAMTNIVTSRQEMEGARIFVNDFAPAAGYQYCYGNVNSTGERAFIYALGDSTTTGTKSLLTTRMPANEFCYLLAGSDPGFVANPGGSDGDLCLGGNLGRYNLISEIGITGTAGTFTFDVDPTAIRQSGGPVVGMAGQTWHFQTWFRDTPAGSGHSNFSNGVAIPLE